MAKGKARHRAQPEVPLPAPPPGQPENPARIRLRQEQLHRAEVRLGALLDRLEAAEERLDGKLRDANSLTKEFQRLNSQAEETVAALGKAIRFISQGEVAEILQEEVGLAIGNLNKALQKTMAEKATEIKAEFDKLYEIMIHVRDRHGKKKAPGEPDIRDMVAGLAYADEAWRKAEEKPQSRSPSPRG